jgi:glycosyltransferase involved in cell wall biosynthesis
MDSGTEDELVPRRGGPEPDARCPGPPRGSSVAGSRSTARSHEAAAVLPDPPPRARGQALVSIVLPTHNGARYIAGAIASCLGQTYRNLELIVVDDGSTDDTAAQVELYGATDRRVRLVRHERNRRLPAALNTGFAAAAGDFLTWTSDDNAYRPEAIEQMVAFLEDRPDVDMVYTDCTLIDETGQVIGRLPAGEPERLLSSDYNCVGPCFLYRRRVRDAVGDYAEDLYLGEDYDYWLRAAHACCLRPWHRDLYYYRMHHDSLSARYAGRIDPVLERALARHLRVARVDAGRKSELCFMFAQRTRARHEILPMLGYLAQSGAYSPRVFARCLARAATRRLGHRRSGR